MLGERRSTFSANAGAENSIKSPLAIRTSWNACRLLGASLAKGGAKNFSKCSLP